MWAMRNLLPVNCFFDVPADAVYFSVTGSSGFQTDPSSKRAMETTPGLYRVSTWQCLAPECTVKFSDMDIGHYSLKRSDAQVERPCAVQSRSGRATSTGAVVHKGREC
jgi:hypothetical protein